MNNAEKPVPLTMSAEQEHSLRKDYSAGPHRSVWPIFQELDATRAALAETREQLLEVSQKWLNAASERDELLPIKAERDALQEQLAQAHESLRNLRINACQLGDFQYGAVRECAQDMIQAIDAALRAKQEPPKKGEHDPAWDKTAQEFLQDALRPEQEPPQSSAGPSKGEGL